MFDIGPEKLLMILAVALVFLGPKKLPDMARSIGKGLREFRNASAGIREEISAQLETPEEVLSGNEPTSTEAGGAQLPVDGMAHGSTPGPTGQSPEGNVQERRQQ
jgi:sec-independent protein translocase protein TatA